MPLTILPIGQQNWKKANRNSADLSQNLAKALGLMNEEGIPN